MDRPSPRRLPAPSKAARRMAGARARRRVRPRPAGTRPMAQPRPRGVRRKRADPCPPSGEQPEHRAGARDGDHLFPRRTAGPRPAAGRGPAVREFPRHRQPRRLRQWRRGHAPASRVRAAPVGRRILRAAGRCRPGAGAGPAEAAAGLSGPRAGRRACPPPRPTQVAPARNVGGRSGRDRRSARHPARPETPASRGLQQGRGHRAGCG